MSSTQEVEADVIVLGSGAAGLTAALAAATAGARVVVLEKADVVGGTTALSGGVIWLPDNRYARDAGVQDSREKSLRYLQSLSNGTMDDEMVEAFVDGVAPLTAWLDSETPVRLELVARYPDYHPENPGGMPGGGRSLENALVSSDSLGEWVEHLVGEARRFKIGDIPSGGGTGVIPPEVMQERIDNHLEGLGRGLIVSLLTGLLERGVEPRLNTAATDLIVEDGRVVGVIVESADGSSEIRAAKGVILATGGFEWDERLVRAFLRGPISHPPGVQSNTGDGLRMAMRVGAELGQMSHGWWVPVTVPETQDLASSATSSLLVRDGHGSALMLRERTLPGTIMVNRTGRRFTNEAANYNAFGTALHAFDPVEFQWANLPAWVILDAACVREYGCFGTAPGQPAPSWLAKGGTLTDLAGMLGIPADSLAETVERWNRSVAEGRDEDFRRGESRYDGWCGDQRYYGTPQATLGQLTEGPFYAASVHPSVLGTKGGPRTDTQGAVIGRNGSTIPGLWAVGNVQAAPTGIAYGGAGGTLGPAMVFGFLAGQGAAIAER